jgi:hypothetical protein
MRFEEQVNLLKKQSTEKESHLSVNIKIEPIRPMREVD